MTLDAIRFLEQIACEPVSAGDYAQAVSQLDVSDLEKHALRARDPAALAILLEARSSMFFGVFAPEEPAEDAPDGDRPEEPLEPERRSDA
ncbi:MAG: hypothetical protein ACJ8GK_00085 [Luteimonas sp.]